MKKSGLCFLLVMVLFPICCSQITTHFGVDSQANFGEMKTFNWIPRKDVPVSPDPKIAKRDAIVDGYIRDTVVKELEEKGMTLNQKNPDFLITYHGLVEDKVDLRDFRKSLSDRLRLWGGMSGNIDVNLAEGSLVLDVVDSRTNKLIWRGVAEGTIDRGLPLPEEEKIIKKAIDKLLAKFPP